MTLSNNTVDEIRGTMPIATIHQLIKDPQMQVGFAWQREPRCDPSELIFMAMNLGFSDVIGVMVITLEESRRTTQFEASGEIR